MQNIVEVNNGEDYLFVVNDKFYKKNVFGKYVHVKPLPKTKVANISLWED